MPREPLHVLLVDGDPRHGRLLREELARTEALVDLRQVPALRDVPSRIASAPCHLLLLNLVSVDPPGLAGMALLSSEAGDRPVVVLVPSAREELALKAIQQGAADFLLIDQIYPTLLARTLHHAVERHGAARERSAAEQAMRASEARYRGLFEQSRDAILLTDAEGTIIDANGAAVELLGAGEAAGRPHLRQLFEDAEECDALLGTLHASGAVREAEVGLRGREGQPLWCLLTASTWLDPKGRAGGFQAILHDITGRKLAEERLLHNAQHDALTGLANRMLFSERLGQTLARWRRHGKPGFAVLFLDLDRFKLVNDSLGHSRGDQLLIQVSEALLECVRREDTVARLGGDEFAVLLEGVDTEEDALRSAARIQERLHQPFSISSQSTFVSASIGIALPGGAEQTPDDLLRNADIAMYRAKSGGSGRWEVFVPGMHTSVVDLHALETDLRLALGRGELVLHYQPILSVAESRIVGVEALVRWQHPTRGLLPPKAFIPLAEETGVITALGHWVLREACRQAGSWLRRWGPDACPTMSINLSGKQLLVPELADQVEEALRESGLPSHLLVLEITESLLLASEPVVVTGLERLRALGVKLSIDDFGTGYSSLSYLHTLPIDHLKIDRSFISGLGTHGDQSELVGTIITLAHRLGMTTVAEGVETAEQLSHIRRLGSHYAQGFLFSVPVDSVRATELLAQRAA